MMLSFLLLCATAAVESRAGRHDSPADDDDSDQDEELARIERIINDERTFKCKINLADVKLYTQSGLQPYVTYSAWVPVFKKDVQVWKTETFCITGTIDQNDPDRPVDCQRCPSQHELDEQLAAEHEKDVVKRALNRSNFIWGLYILLPAGIFVVGIIFILLLLWCMEREKRRERRQEEEQ
jgi:hypothetical protein